jgi:hypothetical protein
LIQNKLQRKHAQDFLRLGPVLHRLRMIRHGQADDGHQIGCIVIDRQRDAVIWRQIMGLLAVQSAEEIKGQAVVYVTDGRTCGQPSGRSAATVIIRC